MHLKSLKDGLEASIPIVGSSIGLSLGSALLIRLLKIIIVEQSHILEMVHVRRVAMSSNLAGIYNLPILFIWENNMYSCNTHLRNRQTSSDMVRFAKSHNIKFEKFV